MSTIYVTKATLPEIGEYYKEIEDIWTTHQLTNMGTKHEKLRAELCNYLDVKNIELLTNGHMALELTLQAMNLQGEVITTPFTFASTTHAIVRNGLEPVFCDIEMDNYTIDVNKLEKLITDKTSAILPVHVYGNVCNIEEIDRIAKKYGLKVLYDAAHTFGETYNNRGIGAYGDASCFSFHATKVFNTIEGGAVTFNDSKLGEKIYELKNFGIHGPEEVSAVGANAKMNEFCAAMGLCNLRHIDENINKRKKVNDLYKSYLEGIGGLILKKEQEGVSSNYAYFPVLIEPDKFGASREEVYETLKNNDIIARKYFYPLTNSFSAFNGKYDVTKTPNALHVSKNIITLPLYPDLSEQDVHRICEIVLKCKC